MTSSVVFDTASSSSQISQVPKDALLHRVNPETFRDISVMRVISKAKFPVYLVNSQVSKEKYVMKVFPYTSSNKPHTHYENESRFTFLNHSNVIKTHHAERKRETLSKGKIKTVSYTLMEYAPHGDFFDLVLQSNSLLDERLVRTYFRQLIEGLEYLHKNRVSHLDLKLENLLLSEDYSLKIADFDLSYIEGDAKVLSRGTKFYRAPEVIQEGCVDPYAADIYSAGVLFFTMKTKGMLPHTEDHLVSGVDFASLLYSDQEEFWRKQCELQKRSTDFFDQDFRDLFLSMVHIEPSQRPTIEMIKRSAWYNGPIYTAEEVRLSVRRLLSN